jgi:hypothetical protein
MIVKISGSGKSFKGLSNYLTHDPNADSDERVAWTHTLNLANDHVPSAVDEMYWTAENAELLKQEAGIRAGGRATENPVKHVSLNWAPDDNPSQQHMIATSEHFLRSMGWNEHQAILIAHDDKSYKHVHIMLNVVHPETGLALNDGFEQRRAQKWALAYEQEQGVIRCEQRALNPEERENAMPRNMWMAFKANEQEFSRAEKIIAENSAEILENPKSAEWKILKEFQRDERMEFFVQGKSEFSNLRNSIYREVREEFRERWAEFYEMRKNGADTESLATAKATLVADQKVILEERRDEACKELRESRDIQYRELLDHQKDMRAELCWRQDAGLDPTAFLNELKTRKDAGQEIEADFRETGRELAGREPVTKVEPRAWDTDEHHDAPVYSGRTVGIDIGGKLGHGVASFAETLFSDLINLGSPPRKPMSAEEKADQFREAAENTLKQHQQHEREEEDVRWRERQRVFGE